MSFFFFFFFSFISFYQHYLQFSSFRRCKLKYETREVIRGQNPPKEPQTSDDIKLIPSASQLIAE